MNSGVIENSELAMTSIECQDIRLGVVFLEFSQAGRVETVQDDRTVSVIYLVRSHACTPQTFGDRVLDYITRMALATFAM